MSSRIVYGVTDGGSVYSTSGTFGGQARRFGRALRILSERAWRRPLTKLLLRITARHYSREGKVNIEQIITELRQWAIARYQEHPTRANLRFVAALVR